MAKSTNMLQRQQMVTNLSSKEREFLPWVKYIIYATSKLHKIRCAIYSSFDFWIYSSSFSILLEADPHEVYLGSFTLWLLIGVGPWQDRRGQWSRELEAFITPIPLPNPSFFGIVVAVTVLTTGCYWEVSPSSRAPNPWWALVKLFPPFTLASLQDVWFLGSC